MAVGFAAPEVGKHRVRPEADRAAVVLDRRRGVIGRQRRIASRDELPIIAFPRRGLIRNCRAYGSYREKRGRNQDAFQLWGSC